MTLIPFTVLCLGIVVELLTLWEQGRASRGMLRVLYTIRGVKLTAERIFIGIVGVLAAILIGLFTVMGWGDIPVYMGQPVVDGIFIALGLFLLYQGMVQITMLPRIDEQAVLGVHTTVVLGLFLDMRWDAVPWLLIAGLALPTLALLGIGLSRRTLAPLVKALVYFWYLICLFVLTFQNDFSALNQPSSTPLLLGEAFVLGASSVFLLLHSLFLMRFFLMVSSLLLPRNHRYMRAAIPRLFDDAQMPRWRTLALPLMVIVVLWLNTRLDLASNMMLVNVLVLILVQGRPQSDVDTLSPSDDGGMQ